MKIFTFFITLLFIISCNMSNEMSENVKSKMFDCAFRNPGSTSQDYIVIKVKNLRSNEIKDICTTPNLLSGALWHEKSTIKFSLNCKEKTKRYFEFSQDSALWNIDFYEYSSTELASFQRHLNVDSIVNLIKSGRLQSVNFGRNNRYFAHIMFNVGVVTTSGCFGTNVAIFNQTSCCRD